VEHAWIVTADDEVEAALVHEDLHVRPPDHAVPEAMDGTALGAIFARLVRMNDGRRHAGLRAHVEERLAGWDLALTRRLAHEAAQRMEPADAVAYVMAMMAGFAEPERAVPHVRAFADAVAGGASAAAIARGIPAADRLLALLGGRADCDASANALGLLFQASIATTRLIEARRDGTTSPPVPLTRRWAARDVALGETTVRAGEAVVVLLTSPRFHFGAGIHRCPGEAVAEAIGDGVLAANRAGEDREDARVARDRGA
jgi:hypothetical protein